MSLIESTTAPETKSETVEIARDLFNKARDEQPNHDVIAVYKRDILDRLREQHESMSNEQVESLFHPAEIVNALSDDTQRVTWNDHGHFVFTHRGLL